MGGGGLRTGGWANGFTSWVKCLGVQPAILWHLVKYMLLCKNIYDYYVRVRCGYCSLIYIQLHTSNRYG